MTGMNPRWSAVGRLLFRSLCTAGGVIAPALVVSDPTFGTLLAAAGSGALGLAAGYRGNLAAGEAEERDKARLPDVEALLSNHELSLLAGASLQCAILSAADTGDANAGAGLFTVQLHTQGPLLKTLADEVPRLFEDLRTESGPVIDALFQERLPNIVNIFAASSERGASNTESELNDYFALLDALASRTDVNDALDLIRPELGEHVSRCFPACLIGILKEDATGRGPAGGRGWAGLTLLFWGRLFSDLQALRQDAEASGHRLADLSQTFAKTAALTHHKLDQLIRWYGPAGLVDEPNLLAWLKSMRGEVAHKLGEIVELIGHGLLSPEEFRRAYWNKRRNDPGLQSLWSEPDRAEALMRNVVGRTAEMADFDVFLTTSSRWVEFWKGWPGTGKSRLMIAFAEHATRVGYRVFFVSSAVHDLTAALLRVKGDEPILLCWDDYQGENPEALRAFLALQWPPANPHGRIVKRVITAWPSHNVLGERAHDDLYVQRDLRPLVGSAGLVAHTRILLAGLGPAAAAQLVRHAQGQPEAVLRAAAFLLERQAVDRLPLDQLVDRLPINLLESAYDNLIRRVAAGRHVVEQRAVKRALIGIALVGSVDLGNDHHRAALHEAEIADEALGALLEIGLLGRDDQRYSIDLDAFRGHVLRRASEASRIDVLSGSPDELASLAQPLLMEWFDAIWRISVLASEGTTRRHIVQAKLLAAFDESLSRQQPPASELLYVAVRIVNATVVEPDSEQCAALAHRIGTLAARLDTEEMAVAQAMALFNATLAELDPQRRDVIVNQIGTLAVRHDTVRMAELHAKALSSTTVVECEPLQCEALANRIGALAARYDTAEIARWQAQALCNAAVGEADPQKRRKLVNLIQRLSFRHDTAEVALAEAKALANAMIVEPDAQQRAAFDNRIGAIAYRHDTVEIARAQAEALFNATINEPSLPQRMALANRIASIAARFDTAAIARAQAQALFNATINEPDPKQRKSLADRIASVAARHDTAEIAVALAQALLNATINEPDPRQRAALADRIGLVAANHDTAAIAGWQAQAIFNATVGEADPLHRKVPTEQIGALADRFDTSEIALVFAEALFNATVHEPDPLQREALADRIGAVAVKHDTAEIVHLQAHALFNAAVGEPSLWRRRALADRISALRVRHETAGIALAEAKALANVTALELDPRQSEAIANRIGELAALYDTPEIVSHQVIALENVMSVEPSLQRRHALANRIEDLYARHPPAE